jgi:tetracycline 7-halogenase / FADH2 O2-dependent halogenase
MTADFDLAIVGSGFGGSLLASIARRLGRTVLLIERGAHPRFAIGESSSPLANLLLEELCARYGLDRLAPLSSWGTWRRAYPGIGCGLKRGFTFYAHEEGSPFRPTPDRRNELLVAASPRDEIADTHWFRADFDHFLVRETVAAGVEYVDRVLLDRCELDRDGPRLEGVRLGARFRARARFLVDASGPRGFLHRALPLTESRFPGLPDNAALYTHFEDVERLEDLGLSEGPEPPPYPVDDAAVHHVFPGGWIWVLRFASGLVSAGIAATPPLARELGLAEGEPAWRRLLARLPTVAEQFRRSRAALPFVYSPRVPFRTASTAGERWAVLPSAAASIDALLSTGIPLTLAGVARLAEILQNRWGRPGFDGGLRGYEAVTLRDADSAALLVAALYATLDDFGLFARLSLLYFASASHTEAARRLGRGSSADAFLSADHPAFGPAFSSVCREVALSRRPLAPEERSRLLARIDAAIEPLDVAGLREPGRRNWHPVEAEPLLESAHKLGATRSEVLEMLRRTGFLEEEAAAS